MFTVTSMRVVRQAKLCALRLSLNTPVVAIEELPVGPAAAGIALHEGADGRSLVLVLRSVRTGQVLCFAPEEGWEDLHGPEVGLDAALTFAESMGFLFDDDPIVGGDPRQAVRKWAEFLAEAAPEGLSESTALPIQLSKFRLRPVVAPALEAVEGREELWLRLLSRF
jgi:hypothetical protein